MSIPRCDSTQKIDRFRPDWRSSSLLNLPESDTVAIIRRIATEFQQYVDRYDVRKYPPDKLDQLREAFASPTSVTPSDIEEALVWKYGHTGKANYPSQQRRLAARIAELWPTNAVQPGQEPAVAFQEWRKLLGPTSFITVCFLLHLANPDVVPILDQHNFRSVNHHLMKAGLTPRTKAKPGRFEDLILVRDFSEAVLHGWPDAGVGTTPSGHEMDRYLMMHGKSLRPARRTKLGLATGKS